MHSSKPQQVRRRNFDTELYDGTCRPSFPFVNWIGEMIESMGANHIMDIHRYPDHVPSESLILSKLPMKQKQRKVRMRSKEPMGVGKPEWFSTTQTL
jgi:hypothetical protein